MYRGVSTVGLRNSTSCDPTRERGNQVFGERPCVIVGSLFIMTANCDIPDDDFFLDVDHLLGDMTNDAPASSSAAPHVILSSLIGLVFGLLLVEIDVDMMLVF